MHRLPMKRDDDDAELDTVPDLVEARRERQCLMCLSHFVSEWSGERVCPKCKQGSAWRQGFTSTRRGRPPQRGTPSR